MKRFWMLTATVLLAFGTLGSVALADDNHEGRDTISFDLGECPSGNLVIDVTHKVLNDGDSGIGRYWAYDNYKKHIRVWQTNATTFCVVTEYAGTFKSTAGSSPAGTGTIAAGVTGAMNGGYRATFTGALNPNSAYNRRGFIGTFDYGWTGNPSTSAPNPFSWMGNYFVAGSGADFDYFWWGWVYATRNGSTWINSQGNAGDIIN